MKNDKIRSNYAKVYGRFYDVLDLNAIPPRERSSLGPKEGRPDIVHRSLLCATDHPLFLMGRIDLLIHTLNGRIFRLSKGIRPPRNYIRFLGLMEKLLREGWVGPREGEPLIWEVGGELRDHLKGNVILLDEEGELRDPFAYLSEMMERGGGKMTVVVGGFPEGEFSEEVRSVSDERLSLYRGRISSSTATSMILTYLYHLEVWV